MNGKLMFPYCKCYKQSIPLKLRLPVIDTGVDAVFECGCMLVMCRPQGLHTNYICCPHTRREHLL